MTNPILHHVSTVSATSEAGTYLVGCNITDRNGETYDCIYPSRPDDTYGLNPTIRDWLDRNRGSYFILPYSPPQPPTPEEVRAKMPAISRRQLLLTLASIGIDGAAVSATLDDPLDRIEWEEAGSFDRLNPLLNEVARSLSLPPEQVDALWAWALGL